MNIGAVSDHRSREGGSIIYPVYSRRSRGLSVGVNLFPGRKDCSFDCPYCEIFPFETGIVFSLELMRSALRAVLLEAGKNGEAVRDICFSGNGEPSLSPHFPQALLAARALRDELAPEARLVLITNGTFLFDEQRAAFIADAAKAGAARPGAFFDIWLKLDAGTETWFRAMARSSVSFAALLERMRAFAASGAPFTLQTMICKVNGALPPLEEEAAWIRLVRELAESPRRLRAVHIYGKARPAPEDPLAEAAPPAALEKRAALLRAAFEQAGIAAPVEVF